MKLYNLTPHAITVVSETGDIVAVFEPEAAPARVSATTVRVGEVNGIPITKSEYSDITGLPAEQEGIGYIVSLMVAQRCTERNDVFIVNEAVRDADGRIIGCKSLATL